MVKWRVGDEVHVLPGKRFSHSHPTGTVVSVGRKYGVVRIGQYDHRFDLATGLSRHTDCNARSNGMGFELFRTRADLVYYAWRRCFRLMVSFEICRRLVSDE